MLLTKEELEASSEIHPDVAEFLKNIPAPDFSDPDNARNNLRAMTDAVRDRLGPPPSATQEFYHDIQLRDGFTSSLKIHKPIQSDVRGPLIVLIFGGGFIAGNNSQMTPTARALVGLFGATVVNISYRLAPEYKFPQGQLDAIDSLRWISDNAEGDILTSDPGKGFIIGGTSAGASIAACLTRRFQDSKLSQPFTGQWLNIPFTMSSKSCPEEFRDRYISMKQNADAPMLPVQAIEMMAAQAEWDLDSDLRCAAASETDIADQPKTYFSVCGMDPLRDDGLIYEEMLKRAGVETRLDFYPGCPHGHAMLMAGTPLGNEGNMNGLLGMGWLLGIEVSKEKAAMAIGLEPP